VAALTVAGDGAGLRKQGSLWGAALRSTFTTEGVAAGLDAAVGGPTREGVPWQNSVEGRLAH
jgi:hypothetical protein